MEGNKRYACIVDQQRHVASLRHGGGDRCRVADVQVNGDHARSVDALGVAHTGVHLARAECHEFFCEGKAETTSIATRDKSMRGSQEGEFSGLLIIQALDNAALERAVDHARQLLVAGSAFEIDEAVFSCQPVNNELCSLAFWSARSFVIVCYWPMSDCRDGRKSTVESTVGAADWLNRSAGFRSLVLEVACYLAACLLH